MLWTQQDLFVLYCLVLGVSVAVICILVMLMHIQYRLDWLDKRIRRIVLDGCKQESEIFNLAAEPIVPPPMAELVPQSQQTPYSMYIHANIELWKLHVKGEDNTHHAHYLRGVMDECWMKLDADQRENAEYACADAWRYV